MAIEPVTREEKFLAAAGGQSVTTPTPITRREQLLQSIIDEVKSGGGQGIPVYNVGDLDADTVVQFAKEYKCFVAYDYEADGMHNMSFICNYRTELFTEECNCVTTTEYVLRLINAGKGYSYIITADQYNEIKAAWADMVGTEA